MSEIKNCPFCGGEAKIKSRYIGYGSVGLGAHDWYSVECKECRAKGDEYGTELGAIAAWNRRAGNDTNVATNADRIRSMSDEIGKLNPQPENARQRALQTGVCPMCEDCPDGCPVEAPNDSRNKPENEPLTLSELYDIDSEPLYFHCTVGAWRVNGWHIVKPINYDGAHFKDVRLDNNDERVESLYNYGITWLAYRRKPERSET